MVFSSYIFIFGFLPLVLGAYYLLPRSWRMGVLIMASYVFYGWWNPWFCLLMLGSTGVDYLCGLWIAGRWARPHTRKPALILSITANLTILAWFKYAAFVADNLNRAAASLGIEAFLPLFQIALPVGISFYTFQSMSYSIDLYRGEASPARSFADFVAFVALFPQLVAGPIIRYRDLDTQLRGRLHTVDLFASGVARFILGLGKKVLIANPCGELADLLFQAGAPTPLAAWVGMAAYAMQIYFDFSGYSDMAIGLGRMFGFRFPENFLSPYRAASITEFWRRWHISLSTFLRDYLYIPLGGNRRGVRRTYINLAAVMLLGGLWHGAQWTFVIWGGLHGGLLALERVCAAWHMENRLPHWVRCAWTFCMVMLAWVFFRSENLDVAWKIFGGLMGRFAGDPAGVLLEREMLRPALLLALGAGFAITWLAPRAGEVADRPLTILRAVGLILLFILSVTSLLTQEANPFLYFQF